MPDEGDERPTTALIRRLSAGDARAREELLPLIYGELRRMAQRSMRHEGPGHTLQPTALVHEAWIKLVGPTHATFSGRTHFLAVAAHAMRSILVDHARARRAQKRGGDRERVALDEVAAWYEERGLDLLDLDGVLARLAEVDGELARVVELRFFGGLTNQEVAGVLGLSTPTIERRWRVARAWLQSELGELGDDGAPDAAAEAGS